MLDELRKKIAQGLIDSSLKSCSRWAEHKIWLPKPYDGLLRFDKFPWCREILGIRNGYVTIKKSSQMGLSVAAMVKALHLVCELSEDVAYVLPNGNLVSDFSKGRLQPLLDLSPELRDIWGEANVGFRQCSRNHASMYIRGSNSQSGLVSIPLGHAICDELDRCAPHTLSLLEERFSARDDFYLMALSTPTLPDHGVDKLFKLGTQEQFTFKCPSCSRHISLRWPESIEICGEHYADDACALSRLRCHECDGTLPEQSKSQWLSKAIWQPSVNVQGHRSFLINGLYSPGLTAERIVRKYLKGELSESARVEFTNQTLAECYISEGSKITPELLGSAKRGYSKMDARPQDSSKCIVMGVDVGMYLDVVIAEYTYDRDPGYEPHLNSTCRILYEARVPSNDWHGLDILMREWQVHFACLDIQPETQAVKSFCRRFHGFAAGVQYRKGTAGNEIKSVEDENGTPTLTVDRTSFMDLALGRFHSGKILLPKDVSATFEEHLQSNTRTYELDEYGNPQAVYVANRDDHFCHALTLAEVAHLKAFTKHTGRPISTGESMFQF